MPIYEYELPDGSVVEIFQSINAEPLTVCPETNQPIRRIVSLNSFNLVGPGWYKNTYGKKDTGNVGENSGDAKVSSSAEQGSSTSSAGETSSASACATNCSCH